MESTAPAASRSPVVPVQLTPRSLAAAFSRVPDPRRVASVAYPLVAMLALAVAAILANQLSELAIAQWASRQSVERLRALGFLAGRTPCQSTLQRLFCTRDGQALAEALSAHLAPVAVPLPVVAGSRGVAIDGTAQRGRLPFQVGGSPVHALTAFCHEHGVVLAAEPIERGEEKGEGELTVAPALVGRIAWPGRVLTGDALSCQRALCAQVLAAGGDYLVLVKGNQPTLRADIALLFDPPTALGRADLVDRREAATRDRGHGRQQEVRHLTASTDLTAYLDWPGVGQVFRLERTWNEHGVPKRALLYGITSLAPEIGPPERLLALKRGHWRIENGLHRVKDVTLREDQSTLHTGQGPTVMAFLRDAALSRHVRQGVPPEHAQQGDQQQGGVTVHARRVAGDLGQRQQALRLHDRAGVQVQAEPMRGHGASVGWGWDHTPPLATKRPLAGLTQPERISVMTRCSPGIGRVLADTSSRASLGCSLGYLHSSPRHMSLAPDSSMQGIGASLASPCLAGMPIWRRTRLIVPYLYASAA